MKFRNFLMVLAVIFIAACNPMEQLGAAEEKIEAFQARYNDRDASVLYRMTGEDFRAATTREQMDGLVALFSGRLGRIESSERTGFNSQFKNGLNITTITMETQFEQGAGTETFVFHGTGEDMELVGWTVNSPRLMLSPDEMRMLSEGDQRERPDPPERRVVPERSGE